MIVTVTQVQNNNKNSNLLSAHSVLGTDQRVYMFNYLTLITILRRQSYIFKMVHSSKNLFVSFIVCKTEI